MTFSLVVDEPTDDTDVFCHIFVNQYFPPTETSFFCMLNQVYEADIFTILQSYSQPTIFIWRLSRPGAPCLLCSLQRVLVIDMNSCHIIGHCCQLIPS